MGIIGEYQGGADGFDASDCLHRLFGLEVNDHDWVEISLIFSSFAEVRC